MVDSDTPLNLEDEGTPPPLDVVPAKDVDGIPYCRIHHCRMTIASGGKKGSQTTYYKCRVRGCEQKEQIVKTRNAAVVPQDPQVCPRCSKGDKPIYCERDKEVSTAAMVILKCPNCGWKSNGMAVPQLAASHFNRGPLLPPVAGVGDR